MNDSDENAGAEDVKGVPDAQVTAQVQVTAKAQVTGDAQAAVDSGEEAADFAGLVVPRVTVSWPHSLLPTLRQICWEWRKITADELLAELPGLWEVIDTALGRLGPNCLVHESLRYDPLGGWQVAALPRYGVDGTLRLRERRDPAAPWTRDRRALVRALVDAVAQRPCRDTDDALLQLGLYAGEFPLGLDALCHHLLGGELRRGVAEGMAPLHDALTRCWSGRVETACYLESGVGSRKARGRPRSDNEDVAAVAVTDSGTVWLGVFDGVTGDGDGSGLDAAEAALAQAGRAWTSEGEPGSDVLWRELDAAVRRATSTGSTAVVMTRIGSDGRAQVLSAGDSEAWLLRPLDGGPTGRRGGSASGWVAWRLTPAHTEFAERLRETPDAHGHKSMLTSYLGRGGGESEADRPGSEGLEGPGFAVQEFPVVPGDLLVLASDGATGADRGRWFGTELVAIAEELSRSSRPLGAALAANLVHRAEALGGWDNATALVCEVQDGGVLKQGSTRDRTATA
ncbi:hypothetical protein [Streptomyces sp. SID13588]|uniref:PP2C family protein-serine/threonine phosphatase n=1 Tax=Streptomyces sp. SID13588 TaxID=2706051 RepID=UPI0013CAB584|nr:hypothetical protein [Streptomyces sp. SID13588]NEA73808.1 hypothetical protein [Streptomyces sp. SID13588]